jgi:DNA-directed RNA polymerase III subunit RPC1
MKILQTICKDCAQVLLEDAERRAFLKQLRSPLIDDIKRGNIYARINEAAKKVKECPHCHAINGQIKKVGVLKLAHDRFVTYNRSTAKSKIPPESKVRFDASFETAKKGNAEVEKHVRKALEDLNPLRVLNLFKKISSTDCELIGLEPSEGRPEMFLWQYVPAPPVGIRPSVHQDNASTEDDLTTKLAEIVYISGLIRAALLNGRPIASIMEQWEYLQLQIAMYVNSEVPGLAQPGYGKTIRGFCQRLKGKQGRFRQNLSGKRVDYSGRTVISPDPNLGIDQVAIPQLVAKNLTYPERVNMHNIDKLRSRVINGYYTYPGAKAALLNGGRDKMDLRYGDRAEMAQDLRIGDVVERHLEDNDIVLFNRQPSLHKLSIMSHLVKVRPWRTFRLNECVCGPYNADFDGDEMNIHVPQTEEARAEAIELMGVKHNLATPKNGEPIIAATQDFVTASFLLSAKDRFFDRKTFTLLCMHMLDGATHLDLPHPAILKPKALWTGKQLFSILIRPNRQSPVLVNLEAKCREFSAPKTEEERRHPPDMNKDDGWLVIQNSEIMCGRMDKSTIGAGKKDSVFYVIVRDFGPDQAVQAMNRLAKLCARALGNRGFSIGVRDVFPPEELIRHKNKLIQDANDQCDQIIERFKMGKLEKATGCTMEQTLENSVSGILSKVRQQAGAFCIDNLSVHNAPMTCAKSGSKGSDLNVAQMVALVGQQIIESKRVPDGFQDRSLPHFHKNSRQPASKGFVANSFYSGLVPSEFLFHAMSGREGLVDTAVKTAETGYMSRRLMKSLEDLSTQYDETVRSSEGSIVQFRFGADNLDPVEMEGAAMPVNFDRTWGHVKNLTMDHEEQGLLPDEVLRLCEEIIAVQRGYYLRRSFVSREVVEYDDEADINVDEHEGARHFLRSIEQYIRGKAIDLARARRQVGLDPRLTDGDEMADVKMEGVNDIISRTDAELIHTEQVAKVSRSAIELFIKLCLDKYKKAQVEPGLALGAVGAQSIGEPGTQMTLKTFHFAGVAGMSITQGVPRIKEIINASTKISTPVITCPLLNPGEIEAARVVRARIEKTYVSDVIRYIEDFWEPDAATIVLQVDEAAVQDMSLDIGLGEIAGAITRSKKLRPKVELADVSVGHGRIEVRVRSDYTDPSAAKKAAKAKSANATTATTGLGLESPDDVVLRVNYLRRLLPTIPIVGYPQANRALIQSSEVKSDSGGMKPEHEVLVEGYGLAACMTTDGVAGTRARTNSVMECRDVLGIEAARSTIAYEIGEVMATMSIDPRHMELLADVMTYRGDVYGITRHGLSKTRDSVLQLASFERTPDHLFEAAARMKTDRVEGVSECVIMGQTMGMGTGGMQVVRRLGLEKDGGVREKRAVFEDLWTKEEGKRAVLRRRRAEGRRIRMAGGVGGGLESGGIAVAVA